MKNYFISVAGNIGAGKTTLARRLEEHTDGNLVAFLEQVDYVKKHRYLEEYYDAVIEYEKVKAEKLEKTNFEAFQKAKQEAEYWGFTLQEAYFFTRLLDLTVIDKMLRKGEASVVQDRSIYEDQLFTQNSRNHGYISQADLERYNYFFKLHMESKPKPDLIIYMESDVPTLKRRILERERVEEFELAKPENTYLKELDNLYRPWIVECEFPKIVIDTQTYDIRTDEGLEFVVEEMVKLIPDMERLFR